MAYILHFQGDNPNRIEEYIVLLDDKPSEEDIEEQRIPGYPDVDVHEIGEGMEWDPRLPVDEALHKS